MNDNAEQPNVDMGGGLYRYICEATGITVEVNVQMIMRRSMYASDRFRMKNTMIQEGNEVHGVSSRRQRQRKQIIIGHNVRQSVKIKHGTVEL